ncbi:MAG: UDP-3-O-[3-hydroxymyristoyl] N-acetylglucosamine deacetylase [SAR324 cluster bacterium]|nr:UDP-3-O-[3-hydroxymyristoyl] N-acetylglucosamine deacetylase [SAR324 cluster bacterium]
MINSEGPICIVDDEASICETLEEILEDEGYAVKSFADAESFLEQIHQMTPALVMLDIWLPGADGMAVLAKVKSAYPQLPVIMMSGHAGIESAVKSIKLGAYDFLEKPLHLEVLLDKVASALAKTPRSPLNLPSDTRLDSVSAESISGSGLASLVESDQFQKTLKRNVVLNGTGLLSGRNTGIILSPLGINQGIIFQTLDGHSIPARVTSLEGFQIPSQGSTFMANSTALVDKNSRVRTVEHLMAVLHMFGLTNVLIKADEEIPNIDGSAEDFCRLIQDGGIEEQSAFSKKIVIHERIGIGEEQLDQKYLYVEPHDEFEIQMRVKYDAPIFEQKITFTPSRNSFEKEIAPARSFNTFENIDMAQKMGKAGGGYLNSHIIIYDGKVINTELRYPDEFVRHKVLDLIGDIYLTGYPIQGRIVANMTSHAYNQALAQKIHMAIHSN